MRHALACFGASDKLQSISSSKSVQVGAIGGCDEEGLASGLLPWPFGAGGTIGAISC